MCEPAGHAVSVLVELDRLTGTALQRGDAGPRDGGGDVAVPGARPPGYAVGAQPVDEVLQLPPVGLGEPRPPVRRQSPTRAEVLAYQRFRRRVEGHRALLADQLAAHVVAVPGVD